MIDAGSGFLCVCPTSSSKAHPASSFVVVLMNVHKLRNSRLILRSFVCCSGMAMCCSPSSSCWLLLIRTCSVPDAIPSDAGMEEEDIQTKYRNISHASGADVELSINDPKASSRPCGSIKRSHCFILMGIAVVAVSAVRPCCP